MDTREGERRRSDHGVDRLAELCRASNRGVAPTVESGHRWTEPGGRRHARHRVAVQRGGIVLFLVFQPGAHRYAIDASQIAEVLPLVAINAIARAPEEVAGLFVYSGGPGAGICLSPPFEGGPAAR